MRSFFIILYIFCIVSNFGIGQIPVPGVPINLSILSILLQFFACFFVDKPRLDKWMIMYFVFLVFYAISASVTGYFGVFFHRFYSFFFMSFVLYWATGILLRRYNTLAPLIYSLFVVGVLDVLVTVFQAYGLPIHNPFVTTIIQNTEQEEFLASQGNELGFSISGIYANAVFNGHLLLLFFLVSLLPQYEKISNKMLLFTFVFLIGLFFCQQRSAFLISVLVFVFFFYNKIRTSKYRFLLSVVFIIAAIFIYRYFVGFLADSGSRLTQTSSTGRELIWMKAIRFLGEHPFFGGYDLFVKEYNVFPHNLLLSAFLAGGLLGGLVLLIMICDQVLYILKRIRSSKNRLYFTLGIMYFGILADSMLHNTGLVEMDFSTFLLWSMFSTIMRYDLKPNMLLTKRK